MPFLFIDKYYILHLLTLTFRMSPKRKHLAPRRRILCHSDLWSAADSRCGYRRLCLLSLYSDTWTFVEVQFETDVKPPEVLRYCAWMVKSWLVCEIFIFTVKVTRRSFENPSLKSTCPSRHSSRFICCSRENEESCGVCSLHTGSIITPPKNTPDSN